MIDISAKNVSDRTAVAEGSIKLSEEGIEHIAEKKCPKGDVIEAAKISALLAVKNTPNAIPHCHPIPIDSTKVDIEIDKKENRITVNCEVRTSAKTGAEMEALSGVSSALLTIWDMVKPVEKNKHGLYPKTSIDAIRVLKKKKEISKRKEIFEKKNLAFV